MDELVENVSLPPQKENKMQVNQVSTQLLLLEMQNKSEYKNPRPSPESGWVLWEEASRGIRYAEKPDSFQPLWPSKLLNLPIAVTF